MAYDVRQPNDTNCRLFCARVWRAASRLGCERFFWRGVDRRRALRLQHFDLGLDRSHRVAGIEYFECRLDDIMPVDGKRDDAVPGLFERARVRVIGGGLQAGDVAVATAGGVLPESEARKLIRVKP